MKLFGYTLCNNQIRVKSIHRSFYKLLWVWPLFLRCLVVYQQYIHCEVLDYLRKGFKSAFPQWKQKKKEIFFRLFLQLIHDLPFLSKTTRICNLSLTGGTCRLSKLFKYFAKKSFSTVLISGRFSYCRALRVLDNY